LKFHFCSKVVDAKLCSRFEGTSLRRIVHLPDQFVIDGKIQGSRVRQVKRTSCAAEVDVLDRDRAGLRFDTLAGPLLVTDHRVDPTTERGEVLRVRSLDAIDTAENARFDTFRPRWISPAPLDPAGIDLARMRDACAEVLASWVGQFEFRDEDREAGIKGLRTPQSGALHGVLAHWKVSHSPCTVVMPTGTGKTETMLALLVNQRLPRLLVVVPNVALRDQISRKFLTLGLLKEYGIVGADALLPVVGVLERRPHNVEEVDDFFQRCNVVVTNMQVLGGCDDAVQDRVAERCSHLFIDEAHHISARTWDAFRRRMMAKVIVQFTATPFGQPPLKWSALWYGF
jgi:hypothetical protein